MDKVKKAAKPSSSKNKLAIAVATMPQPSAPKQIAYEKGEKERQRMWKAEDALRDIERADRHRNDKTLMKDVSKLAQERIATLKKIC